MNSAGPILRQAVFDALEEAVLIAVLIVYHAA